MMQGLFVKYKGIRFEKRGVCAIIDTSSSCFSGNSTLEATSNISFNKVLRTNNLNVFIIVIKVDTNVGRIAVRLGWVPLQPLPESLQLHLLEM